MKLNIFWFLFLFTLVNPLNTHYTPELIAEDGTAGDSKDTSTIIGPIIAAAGLLLTILTLYWNCHQKHVELRALAGLPPEDRPGDRARVMQEIFGRIGHRGVLIEIKNRTAYTLRTERHAISLSGASIPGGLPELIPAETNRVFYFKIPYDFLRRAATTLTCNFLRATYPQDFQVVVLVSVQETGLILKHFLLGISLGRKGPKCYLQAIENINEEFLTQFEDANKIRFIESLRNWEKNSSLLLTNASISTRLEILGNNQKKLIFEILSSPILEQTTRQALRPERHLFETITPEDRTYND